MNDEGRVPLAVIGLGYVGLPLAVEAVGAGVPTLGFDVDAEVVAGLSSGRSHVDDVSDARIAAALEHGFSASDDEADLDRAAAFVICVPTPLSDDGSPDLRAVRAATSTVGRHLAPGCLVVLESTTYPGTTDVVVRAILEEASGLVAGEDFHLAYSPERIDPGNAVFGVRNTPKVVGGLTPRCTELAVGLYGRFIETVVTTPGTREAEFAKLLENTYRHVNIALVNEMAIFANEMDIDLWATIDAASTKPFGFQAFYPGPGVGGHCIPIDPSYLSYAVRSLGYQFRFVELAQEISGRMPAYVVLRVQDLLNDASRSVKGSRIALLGVAYKADISDTRETPATGIASRLLALGADVVFHDPHVAAFEVDGRELEKVDSLQEATNGVDLVVVLQTHRAYLEHDWASVDGPVFDTRGRLDGPGVVRL